MLYDQAQIAGNFIEAFSFSRDERFAAIASHLFAYLDRDLRHPEGAFFSAEDADSFLLDAGESKREGAYYLWHYNDLKAVVGDQLDWFLPLFGIREEGNISEKLDPQGEMKGRNVLHQARSIGEVASTVGLPVEILADRLEELLEALRLRRENRPRPHRDEKIVTAWNGLMIGSLSRASVCGAVSLRECSDHYREMAETAAAFVRRYLWNAEDQTLSRTWREGKRSGAGLAEDYAGMIHGLLELYDATFAIEWLKWADELQTAMDLQFWDEVGGGYFQGLRSDPSIVLQLKDDYDGAEPSANSLAATNLFRLAALLHDEARHARAMKTLQAFRHIWTETPWALPAMLGAVEWSLAVSRHVLILGESRDPEFQRMVEVARDRRVGRRVTLAVGESKISDWLQQRLPHLRQLPGRTQAQVCSAFECAAPVFAASDLLEALNQ